MTASESLPEGVRPGRLLTVIPARGGSKGVPGKNLQPVAGMPLIGHTIRFAVDNRDLSGRILVTTDDPEIVAVAERLGAEAPFLRPAELAGDRTPMLPVLQHAVAWAEHAEGRSYDWVLLLQPTAPLRLREDLSAVLLLAAQGGCDSVISVRRVLAEHPMLMKQIVDGQLAPYCIDEPEGTRRQDYDPPAYMRNGCFYLTRRTTLMEQHSIWGDVIRPYVMPEERSINVDSLNDLEFLRWTLERRNPVP